MKGGGKKLQQNKIESIRKNVNLMLNLFECPSDQTYEVYIKFLSESNVPKDWIVKRIKAIILSRKSKKAPTIGEFFEPLEDELWFKFKKQFLENYQKHPSQLHDKVLRSIISNFYEQLKAITPKDLNNLIVFEIKPLWKNVRAGLVELPECKHEKRVEYVVIDDNKKKIEAKSEIDNQSEFLKYVLLAQKAKVGENNPYELTRKIYQIEKDQKLGFSDGFMNYSDGEKSLFAKLFLDYLSEKK